MSRRPAGCQRVGSSPPSRAASVAPPPTRCGRPTWSPRWRTPGSTETSLFRELDRGGIGWNASGLDAMQPKSTEGERDQRAHRGGHEASVRVGGAHPVAKTAGLCAAAADVGERQTAEQDLVAAVHDKERIRQIPALILGVALDPSAESRAGQIIGRPGRLPGAEEIAAC